MGTARPLPTATPRRPGATCPRAPPAPRAAERASSKPWPSWCAAPGGRRARTCRPGAMLHRPCGSGAAAGSPAPAPATPRRRSRRGALAPGAPRPAAAAARALEPQPGTAAGFLQAGPCSRAAPWSTRASAARLGPPVRPPPPSRRTCPQHEAQRTRTGQCRRNSRPPAPRPWPTGPAARGGPIALAYPSSATGRTGRCASVAA
mmetsp:Transcript_115439/g.373007  ORF Transcript_115439/g.373007 Transcript_115439/m.373007 type:complete len:204 (+) Transcript_115439:737-1348(+)